VLISDRAVSTANKGPLDPLEVAQGPDAILGRIFGYYAGILKEPESQPQDPPKSQAQQIVEREQRFTLFWKYLTRQDHHSMRSYLLTTVRLDEATVEWLETNSSGTGLYNLQMTWLYTLSVSSLVAGCNASISSDACQVGNIPESR